MGGDLLGALALGGLGTLRRTLLCLVQDLLCALLGACEGILSAGLLKIGASLGLCGLKLGNVDLVLLLRAFLHIAEGTGESDSDSCNARTDSGDDKRLFA